MKQTISLLSILLLLTNLTQAQTEEKKSVSEFNSGRVSKFSSYGQGKSQGLKIHFKYPKSWESIEGERPHVVRKFAQSDDYVLALILVKKQEQTFSQSEISEVFTTGGLKSIIPSSGTYISSNGNLKIEGLQTGSVEFTNSGLRMNRPFFSYNLNYLFFYKQYFINVQFMVINKIGETNSSVTNRYETVKPLLEQMFNSIVIDNIWD
jgi:hypothetical protein